MITRRLFVGGLIATPAVVKASSLMPIRGLIFGRSPAMEVLPLYAQLSQITREAMIKSIVEMLAQTNDLLKDMDDYSVERRIIRIRL